MSIFVVSLIGPNSGLARGGFGVEKTELLVEILVLSNCGSEEGIKKLIFMLGWVKTGFLFGATVTGVQVAGVGAVWCLGSGSKDFIWGKWKGLEKSKGKLEVTFRG